LCHKIAWIRIRIRIRIRILKKGLDPDPDPDPYNKYTDPQHWFWGGWIEVKYVLRQSIIKEMALTVRCHQWCRVGRLLTCPDCPPPPSQRDCGTATVRRIPRKEICAGQIYSASTKSSVPDSKLLILDPDPHMKIRNFGSRSWIRIPL